MRRPPLAAILLKTCQCIADKGVACASAGSNPDKYANLHDGKDTNTVIDSDVDFWAAAFSFVILSFSFDHTMNITGPNMMASIRYIKGMQFTYDGCNVGLPPPSTICLVSSMLGMNMHSWPLMTIPGLSGGISMVVMPSRTIRMKLLQHLSRSYAPKVSTLRKYVLGLVLVVAVMLKL